MTQPGDVFSNRYEIQRSIARGGMAEVFLARDQLLDRPVAVKVLSPEFARDQSFVERFRREAQARRGPEPPQHRRDLRLGPGAAARPSSSWSTCTGARCATCSRSNGPLEPRQAAADRRRHRGRARLRAPQRRRAPRREARQRAHHRRARREGHRLRHRPRRRHRGAHPDRRGDGHRHLLLARTGAGLPASTGGPTCTRSASCSTRWSPGVAAVHRRQPGVGRVQARARGADAAVAARARAPATISSTIVLTALAKDPDDRYQAGDDAAHRPPALRAGRAADRRPHHREGHRAPDRTRPAADHGDGTHAVDRPGAGAGARRLPARAAPGRPRPPPHRHDRRQRHRRADTRRRHRRAAALDRPRRRRR